MKTSDNSVATKCDHCGDPCEPDSPGLGEKHFCCEGCKTVYLLLQNREMGDYYAIEDKPGLRPSDGGASHRFDYLDDPVILERLLDFTDGSTSRITFSIPQMHCSSCIWLLENLHTLKPAIISSRVDFPRRTVSITFRTGDILLSSLTGFLATLGYEPDIKLADLDRKSRDVSFRRLYTQLAVAGFCFGNVMLLSFPEYLGLDVATKPAGADAFGYLNVILSLPVFFYCAYDYFQSAWTGIRHKQINMDVPISLGIFILFSRSLFNVLYLGQAGYIDSLCALVFLLLVGRVYQKKTYASLSFDRDFTSYLPISVIKIQGAGETSIGIHQLEVGDRIMIRNRELIPGDAVLLSGEGHVDYSFVTGESEPITLSSGQRVYAGGRQIGSAIELELIKKPSESYLMQLWTQTSAAVAQQPHLITLANQASRIFTPTIVFIAIATAGYWLMNDSSQALDAATAVLIVACPCALALSTPFALGTLHRIFGKSGLYLKSPDAIERLSGISTIVFDKTGTITQAGTAAPIFEGEELSDINKEIIFSMTRQSTHPLSAAIADSLNDRALLDVSHFVEIPGLGLEGTVANRRVRIGSGQWIGLETDDDADTAARVYVSIDGQNLGYFHFAGQYRPGLAEVISQLVKNKKMALLSGDNEGQKKSIQKMFGSGADIRFRQTPHEKLEYVNDKMMSGEKILMVGDGLNDAGALQAASVGISIVERHSAFSPACDGILDAAAFALLPEYLRMSRTGMTIIKTSFAISFAYNIIGIAFAVQGLLSPVIAAILMPASSVSVVLFATIATTLAAKRRKVV